MVVAGEGGNGQWQWVVAGEGGRVRWQGRWQGRWQRAVQVAISRDATGAPALRSKSAIQGVYTVPGPRLHSWLGNGRKEPFGF